MIAILGLGWLGLPLAQQLLEKGYKVRGSVTSVEKKNQLTKEGIPIFQIQLNETGVEGDVKSFFNNTKIVIIAIPPKLRNVIDETNNSYFQKINFLVPLLQKNAVEKVIFISSTSVFGDNQGNIDEDSIPKPDTISGKQISAVEQLLLSQKAFKTNIIRMGGLLGNDRQPAHFLSGKKLANAQFPINMIHQIDAIALIQSVIETNTSQSIFHGVYPTDVNKEVYYAQKSNELGVEPPIFEKSQLIGKKINSWKTQQVLMFTFQKAI